MEPIWVLRRCYRMIPDAACHIVGVYQSAGSAIAHAEEAEQIPPDAWKQQRQGEPEWHVDDRLYTYKLESFRIPAAPPAPPLSIEIDAIH